MIGNTFYLQGYDGSKDHTIEVNMQSEENTLVLKTPEGYQYRLNKKDLRTLVAIMNTMDENNT
jgi:hypothetical protein